MGMLTNFTLGLYFRAAIGAMLPGTADCLPEIPIVAMSVRNKKFSPHHCHISLSLQLCERIRPTISQILKSYF